MKTVLVCGYRRTGKDTFYNILSTRPNDTFKWRIYKHPTAIEKKFDGNIYVRTAFADPLKREASEIYGIPLVVSDADKDIKQFKHYKTGELVSARDIYIEWGAIRRLEDTDYWCKAAFRFVDVTDSNINCVVTDWRFRNEASYVINNLASKKRSFFSRPSGTENVITVRLYRSEVPEPPADIESEHDLDKYRTNFLLLRDGIEGEFEKAIEKFPRYADYIPCECL